MRPDVTDAIAQQVAGKHDPNSYTFPGRGGQTRTRDPGIMSPTAVAADASFRREKFVFEPCWPTMPTLFDSHLAPRVAPRRRVGPRPATPASRRTATFTELCRSHAGVMCPLLRRWRWSVRCYGGSTAIRPDGCRRDPRCGRRRRRVGSDGQVLSSTSGRGRCCRDGRTLGEIALALTGVVRLVGFGWMTGMSSGLGGLRRLF
jgi:hypothetical protein